MASQPSAVQLPTSASNGRSRYICRCTCTCGGSIQAAFPTASITAPHQRLQWEVGLSELAGQVASCAVGTELSNHLEPRGLQEVGGAAVVSLQAASHSVWVGSAWHVPHARVRHSTSARNSKGTLVCRHWPTNGHTSKNQINPPSYQTTLPVYLEPRGSHPALVANCQTAMPQLGIKTNCSGIHAVD